MELSHSLSFAVRHPGDASSLGKKHCVKFFSPHVLRCTHVVVARRCTQESHCSAFRCCYKMHPRQIQYGSATRLLQSFFLTISVRPTRCCAWCGRPGLRESPKFANAFAILSPSSDRRIVEHLASAPESDLPSSSRARSAFESPMMICRLPWLCTTRSRPAGPWASRKL